VQVREALVHIERGRLLSPLLVLQTLASNQNLTLAVVKQYVGRCLAEDSAALAEDQVRPLTRLLLRSSAASLSSYPVLRWRDGYVSTFGAFSGYICASSSWPCDLYALAL
jgi:hypothetical protein